jgi:hypothetical protein
MLTALLFSLLPLHQEASEMRLVTEDLEGRPGLLSAADLPLADPRTKGVWIVRPVGFPPQVESKEAQGAEVRLTLINGDELSGRVRGGEGEELRLELAGGVVVPFALDDVRSLSVPSQLSNEERQALAPAAEGDRLYRVAGAMEPIDGTLEGFAPDGLRFDSVLGSRTIPWNEVGALFLESLGGATPRASVEAVPVVVAFAGAAGGRVRGDLKRLERERCRVVLGGKTEVELPLAAVAEILVADGRLTFVSELAPSGETGRGAPFGDELGMAWPHRVDQSVLGTELHAGGLAFRRGLGMHAPSRLSFTLEPGFRALRGKVAIDDSARTNPPAARGSVIFRVLGDGKVLWQSALVRGGDAPLALPTLALGETRELVLEADPAGDFAGDRADWLELMLVR